MSSNQDKGVPLAEAAKQLDVSQELLRKRIYRGLVTGHKVGGRWYVVLNGQASRPDSIQDSKQDHSGRNQDCQDKRDSLFEAIIDGQRSEIGFLRDEMAKQREQWAEEARRKDIIIADLMTAQPRYRVEHHTNGTTRVLGVTDDWAMTALAPFAIDLLAQRETGQLLLIEQATGRVVDRRSLVLQQHFALPALKAVKNGTADAHGA